MYGLSKEENVKLGFGGLKLGMILYRLLVKFGWIVVCIFKICLSLEIFIIIFVCDKL